MANSTDKSILTAAGKALLAQLNAEEKALVIDKMIFANVPNRPEYPQPDDVVPTDHIVHQEQVEQRGRLSADSVIYSSTLTSDVGPFDFNWTGAYCSEYGVLVTIDHHALTPKTADEPGVAGNTLVRSVVLEYKDIAEITNITVDASSWQYNATERMKKMDSDVAQSIIDQNGKDWFIEDGFLVTPSGSAYSIKAGAGYVSGNRVAMEFDRSVQVPNKPSFIYIDAHREGTPTGEQVTLFNFVVTAEEKDDYIDSSTGKDVKHFVCKIAQVHADGSVSDLRPEGDKTYQAEVKSSTAVSQATGLVVFPEKISKSVSIGDLIPQGVQAIRVEREGKVGVYVLVPKVTENYTVEAIDWDLKSIKFSGIEEVSYLAELNVDYSRGDVRRFGAVDLDTDPNFDCTYIIKLCLELFKECWIPFGKRYKYSSNIDLRYSKLSIYGVLEQHHNGVGIRQQKDSTLKFGPHGELIRASDRFDDPLACVVLFHNDLDDGSCAGNECINPVIKNKHTPSQYPSITPKEHCEGRGIWLLAGGNYYGLSAGDVYERVTENRIVKPKIRGFRQNIVLEARYLDEKQANGWVNGNFITSPSCFEGEYLIDLLCDGVDEANKLLGEVSGNHFTKVNLQDDAGRTTRLAIRCQGWSNYIQGQIWDTSSDRYPYIAFERGRLTPTEGRGAGQNTIDLSTDLNNKNNGTLSNGAYTEVSAGTNSVNFGKMATQNYFPISVPPDSLGSRQKPSWIGVVENYFAFAAHPKNDEFEFVKVKAYDGSSEVDITSQVADIDEMFTPESHTWCRVDLHETWKAITITVKSKESMSIELAGVTNIFGREGLITKCRVEYFDENGSLISTQEGPFAGMSTWHTDVTNVQGVRSCNFRLTVDPTVHSSVNIGNVFARLLNRRDDKYHVRRDGDSIHGPLTFGKDYGPRIMSGDGSVFQIAIDNEGNIFGVKL